MSDLRLLAIDLATNQRRFVAPSTGDGSSHYDRAFTQADLSLAGVLPVTHSLSSFPSGVALWTASGELVGADSVEVLTIDTIAVDLNSFTPLQGTWTISVTA